MKSRLKQKLIFPFKALYRILLRPFFKVQNLVDFYYSVVHYGSYRLFLTSHLTLRQPEGQGVQYLWQQGTVLPHPQGLVIGVGVKLGRNCCIFQNVTMGTECFRDGYPTIGDNVIIFPNCVLSGPIKIGDNAIIAPNSVVTKDVPENAIVGGVPAKLLRYREGKVAYLPDNTSDLGAFDITVPHSSA